MENSVRINFDLIPDSTIQCGCRILNAAVRNYFKQPGIKEEYEKWKAKRQKGKDYEARKNTTGACGGDRTAE